MNISLHLPPSCRKSKSKHPGENTGQSPELLLGKHFSATTPKAQSIKKRTGCHQSNKFVLQKRRKRLRKQFVNENPIYNTKNSTFQWAKDAAGRGRHLSSLGTRQTSYKAAFCRSPRDRVDQHLPRPRGEGLPTEQLRAH